MQATASPGSPSSPGTHRRRGQSLAASLWPQRLLWFVLPALMGPGLLDGVAGHSTAVQRVVEYGAWGAWFLGLVSLFAPSTVTLTLLRTVAPAAVAGPLLIGLTAATWPGSLLVSLAAGVIAAGVMFLAVTGDPMINGSAYGSERRMALRPPASLLLGPLYLVWLAVFAGVVTGPLLLAAGHRPAGVAATVVGAPVVVLGVRSLHQLSRRWVVFVPAGFVIHDYWSLAESLLVQRSTRPVLGAAQPGPGSDGAVDLSAGAYGLALSVRLVDPFPAALRRGRQIESITAAEFWFSPSLPGKVLTEARVRAITLA